MKSAFYFILSILIHVLSIDLHTISIRVSRQILFMIFTNTKERSLSLIYNSIVVVSKTRVIQDGWNVVLYNSRLCSWLCKAGGNKQIIFPSGSRRYPNTSREWKVRANRRLATTYKPSGACRRINQLMTAPLCPITPINSLGVSAKVPVARFDRVEPTLWSIFTQVILYIACCMSSVTIHKNNLILICSISLFSLLFFLLFHEKKLRIYLYNTRQYLLLPNKIQMVIHRPISWRINSNH